MPRRKDFADYEAERVLELWREGDFSDDELYDEVARAVRLARIEGLRCGLQLAKEHISFDDNAHVTGRLGEGRPNWADAERAVEEECK